MATWAQVRRLALSLPETSERESHAGAPQWRVRDKLFAWDRPLGRSDIAALGDAAPEGPVLAARVPDLGVKDVLVAESPGVYFTMPHFDGYAAILVRLGQIGVGELEELLTEAWLVRAPKRVATAYLEATG